MTNVEDRKEYRRHETQGNDYKVVHLGWSRTVTFNYMFGLLAVTFRSSNVQLLLFSYFWSSCNVGCFPYSNGY